MIISKHVGRKPKISEISEIRGLLKIIVVYKEVEAYEEQGILEDIDSDCRHSIDGTGDDADNYVMYGQWPILTTSSLTLVRVWRCNAWVTARSKGGLKPNLN